MDFWNIMDVSEEALPSNAKSKVLKEYERRIKKVVSIISLNLTDNQLAHIKICKGPTEVCMTWSLDLMAFFVV